MLDYKKILGLRYGSNLSGREIAASCGYSKSAVNEFLKRFRESGQLRMPLGPDVTNEGIEELLYSKRGVKADTVESLYRKPDCEAMHKALAKKGETLKRLWRKYNSIGVVDGRGPYSYRQYCQKYSQWLDEKKISYHIVRHPGVNLELDFAGKVLYLRNSRIPGAREKVTIFVATLSYSKYFYAEGLTCCDSRNWIRVNNNALRFFGGVTQICTPDNAKVAVLKNMDWIDPILNKDFQEWAAHYGTAIMPAVVKGPTFKPNVEASVGFLTTGALMDMDEMTFFSLDALNDVLWQKMDELNSQNFQSRDYSRRDLFERPLGLQPQGGAGEVAGQRLPRIRRAFEFGLDDRLPAVLVDQPVDRVERENTPVIEYGDAVAQPLGLLHVVCRIEDGASLAPEGLDGVEDLVARLRVDPDRGLVQKQERRIVHDGAGEIEAAHHAAGKRLHQVAAAVRQTGELERPRDPRGEPGPGEAVEAAEKRQVLGRGEVAVERERLRGVADLSAQRRPRRIIDPVQTHPPGIRRQHTDHHADRGGLAGTVRPEQAEGLAGGDVE